MTLVEAILRLKLTQCTISRSKISKFYQFLIFVKWYLSLLPRMKGSMNYSKVNCTNPKTGIESEIIETEIIKIKI